NIGMVVMVNGLYMLLTLLRTRFEDGWGEGLVPMAANVARNELLSCVGVLGFAVVLRKMIWLKVELRLDRGNMEAQLSAASSLLRLTCDAVLELDQELRLKSHCPALAAMLLRDRPGASLEGTRFT
ncbi:DBP2, partial [Symbiodinium sp. CCMP2456]